MKAQIAALAIGSPRKRHSPRAVNASQPKTAGTFGHFAIAAMTLESTAKDRAAQPQAPAGDPRDVLDAADEKSEQPLLQEVEAPRRRPARKSDVATARGLLEADEA